MASKRLMGSMSSNNNLTRRLAAAVLALGLVAPACITEPDSADNDATNVILQVVSMGSADSDFQGVGQTVTDLLSDVCFADDSHPPCTVFNDNGVVTLRAIQKDRTRTSSPIDDVMITRYRVTYVRADGRNVPGVDVPYPFDGAANFLVPSDGSDVEWSFIVVRHQAKVESPLRELSLTGQLFSVLAQIDFFGHDSAGRSIQVTGYLNITFGDFANGN